MRLQPAIHRNRCYFHLSWLPSELVRRMGGALHRDSAGAEGGNEQEGCQRDEGVSESIQCWQSKMSITADQGGDNLCSDCAAEHPEAHDRSLRSW